jgi:hypothetical protein
MSQAKSTGQPGALRSPDDVNNRAPVRHLRVLQHIGQRAGLCPMCTDPMVSLRSE